MKRIEFAGKQLNQMGIRLEKFTYGSTVYKVPVVEPAATPGNPEKSERRPKQIESACTVPQAHV
jgi:hypothetical protein